MSTPWTDAGRKMRLAILCSGSGSNFNAILNAISQSTLDAQVVAFGTDHPDSGAANIANRYDISCVYRSQTGSRSHRDGHFAAQLKAYEPDLVVLAGYMQILSESFLSVFRDRICSHHSRIVNIHPSLLPLYPGLNAAKQAIDDGATQTGTTVHIVDSGVDTGPILDQCRVPVRPGDTPERLQQRIQDVEHCLFSTVLARIQRIGLSEALENYRVSS